MERDGCAVVGMTAMPEAVLARELEMEYAACAVVSNAAAGRGPAEITMEDVYANLERGMRGVRRDPRRRPLDRLRLTRFHFPPSCVPRGSSWERGHPARAGEGEAAALRGLEAGAGEMPAARRRQSSRRITRSTPNRGWSR